MRIRADLTGKQFGYLEVIGHDTKRVTSEGKKAYWVCKCVCGVVKSIASCSLVYEGTTKSCGCLRRVLISKSRTKHGYCKYGKIFRCWNAMKHRCYSTRNTKYKYYGGKGIKVCKRWHNFENFYKDMGDPPTDKHTLDRVNSELDYSKSNCRWATRLQQSRNLKSNRLVTFQGQTLCLSEWAEQVGVSANNIRLRLNSGWSVEKALTTPVRK